MFKNKENEEVGLSSFLEGAMKETDPEPPRSRKRLIGTWLASVMVLGLGVGLVSAPAAVAGSASVDTAINFWNELPSDLPVEYALPQHTILLDQDGKEFARFYSENRIDVSLDQVNKSFVSALLSTEDARFYEHNGLDPIGTARALASNLLGIGGTQGASTITQQLVQNILISNARTSAEEDVAVGTTYNAKLRELKYAVALEEQYTKDEILTMYMNAVYFGNGAYGVEAAARVYFDKHAKDLTAAESALLVAQLKSPTAYDPYQRPNAAAERRATVLSRMVNTGALTADEAAKASASELGLERGSIPSGCDASDFPYYCAQVRDEIKSDPAFGETQEMRDRTLARGGMTLTTGLDRQAQKGADRAATSILGNDNRVKTGIAVVEPGTGRLAAIAQNSDWADTEVIYASRAFQPGSAMKPFVMAAALEQGIPATTVMSTDGPYFPSGLDAPAGGFNNYGNYKYGAVSGYEALTRSTNVYFIRLTQKAGVKAVAEMSRRLGLATMPTNLTGRESSIALGVYDVSPLDMAGAYATFAAGGVHCEPTAVQSAVRTATGEKLAAPDANCHQAVNSAVADTVGAALKGPLADPGGTLKRLGGLAGGRPAGAKTGTTNGSSANWTAGVTPDYAAAVWLGDPRGGFKHPLDVVHTSAGTHRNLTGAEVAGPLWKRTMDAALKGVKHHPMPKADNAGTSQSSARRVPDVRGMTLPAALDAVKRAGMIPVLDAKTAERPAGVPTGTVVAQTPAGSSTMGHQQQITLTLGHGSNTEVSLAK